MNHFLPIAALRGAKYATTKTTLKAGELVSCDQGFDGSEKQVWGATKAGYILDFLRKYPSDKKAVF